MFGGGQPVFVLQQNVQREHGRQTQIANIQAAAAVSSVVRSTLGPKSMLKLLLDPLGGVVITNDGNAILREIDVTHPAAKSLIELSRAQDEEVGDGTTSVVILTGEILARSEKLLGMQIHPTLVVKGYFAALTEALKVLEEIATDIDLEDATKLREVVGSCMGTKFSAQWGAKITGLALEAAQIVQETLPNGKREVDTKRYARIEKVPGGSIEDCQLVKGIAIEKDVTHARMKRRIQDPKIVLLDCPLEYKKGESMTNVEITQEEEFEKLLLQEEEEVRKMCDCIAATGCNLVITEKGVSDLAAHFLMKQNISVVRRAKKTDQNRLARVTGATIVNRCEELTERDVGTKCGLFEVKKIDDDYWTFLTDCAEPRACTILLRGGSKDSLNEIERNLHDALAVARNIFLEGKLLPGGGACDMICAKRLHEAAKRLGGLEQWGMRAVAEAFDVIPRILAQNAGVDVVTTIAKLRAAPDTSGIDGVTGEIVDVTAKGIWDTYRVKTQMIKTAIECAAMLIRVDDVLSGIGKPKEPTPEVTNYA
ncbi:putative chaperonin containing T-complex 1 gamma subunit, tcpg protein [Gregarina niphandrodes]|uniref:T-complex protein 1 subunit gamma n=1 Tax=Gregarina niphandrodes TaxID=110365 RepID=A0A023AY77_GRENI|nr:putative chaperonin containing T-complex 1 gamma subunit, tcpg protein [Gregarina niphandrodes]EZG43611.1 putative chaperonin containing T-complex 1 gamma subunit, tcpg protein [Gregarina niphandrodes]|eukprot:XP_011133157.1 putative chaperonin containing T-complex 1 gamma subunit, tcpg protein [Gregarina niphandrodes]